MLTGTLAHPHLYFLLVKYSKKRPTNSTKKVFVYLKGPAYSRAQADPSERAARERGLQSCWLRFLEAFLSTKLPNLTNFEVELGT